MEIIIRRSEETYDIIYRMQKAVQNYNMINLTFSKTHIFSYFYMALILEFQLTCSNVLSNVHYYNEGMFLMYCAGAVCKLSVWSNGAGGGRCIVI